MRATGPLIQVVDDDASVCRSLSRLLQSLGLQSRTFLSGREMLSNEKHSEARCTIVDVHMVEMNGYEVAQRLYDEEPDSLVIFMTADREQTNLWRKETPTGVALLLKPFTETELTAVLELALGPGFLEEGADGGASDLL